MPVRLKSRLPMIERELPVRVQEAAYAGAQRVATEAASRAPQRTGALRSSIEARPTTGGAEIHAAWYWFLVEFGTSRAGPHPYMMPAVEQERASMEAEIGAALRNL